MVASLSAMLLLTGALTAHAARYTEGPYVGTTDQPDDPVSFTVKKGKHAFKVKGFTLENVALDCPFLPFPGFEERPPISTVEDVVTLGAAKVKKDGSFKLVRNDDRGPDNPDGIYAKVKGQLSRGGAAGEFFVRHYMHTTEGAYACDSGGAAGSKRPWEAFPSPPPG